jgi:hypothetical protein
MHGMNTAMTEDLTARMMRQVRKAELAAKEKVYEGIRRGEIVRYVDNRGTPAPIDPGSGHTVLKRSDSPVTRLLNSEAIGASELQAAQDICLAFRAISGALFLKPLSMERRDRSNSIHEPARVIDATSRYQAWARLWSDRSKRGDPTLEIVIAAVWDERAFRVIEQDLNIRNGTAAKATAAGLRDYAARAGWAQGSASKRWLVSEGAVFRLRRVS